MSEPRYVAVEGPIGAGATTLAHGVASRSGGKLFLDRVEENRFLERFYADPRRYALPSQLAFLWSRWDQQRDIARHAGMNVVSDYAFARDDLFAGLTLDDDEYDLYRAYAAALRPEPPEPGLIVYLQADPDTLLRRLEARGRAFEREITRVYLEQVVKVYNGFFFHYTRTPLLVVDTNNIDFVNDGQDLDDLLREIDRSRVGTRYYTIQSREDEA